MKRIFTLLVAMAAIATTASAQLQFGVEAGLNVNLPSSFDNATIKQTVDPKNSLGWFAGLKAKYQFAMGLGVDGAVLYSQKKNDMGESSKDLRYIDVPINLRYQLGLGSLLSIYAAAGPQWSVNIGDRDWGRTFSQTIQDQNLNNVSGTVTELYQGALNNLSINLGAGVLLMKHLQVGFTYNIPITKGGELIYTLPNADPTSAIDTYNSVKENWKNNSWQIRAAYFF